MSHTITNNNRSDFVTDNGQDIILNNSSALAGDICQVTPVDGPTGCTMVPVKAKVDASGGQVVIKFSGSASSAWTWAFNLITP